LGDEKDGTIATRVTETMRLKHKEGPGQGHIVMSTGVRDEETWGKRADWCYYYGPVSGGTNGPETLGVAIFDHPGNPRHPTNWHVRDYGLFAANPFGLSFFERKPKHAGDMTIAAGQSVTFRYRFYYHRGDEKEARVAEHYQKYAAEGPPSD
jgi:Methane oxygenase PmoA